MPLPTDLQTGTLTGVVRSLQDGSAIDAIVEIVPDFTQINDLPGGAGGDTGSLLVGPIAPVVIDTSTPVAGTSAAWQVTVDGSKKFSTNLLGFSDLLNPTQFTYHCVITRKSNSEVLADFHFRIPAGVTLDLSAITPVRASTGTGVAAISIISGGGEGGVSSWEELQDKPEVIAAGDTEADARQAIGAVAIGPSAGDAKPGNYRPAWNGGIDGRPELFPPTYHQHDLEDFPALTPTGKALLAGTAAAGRSALGATTVGSSVFTIQDFPALLQYLGIASVISDTAAATAAVANLTTALNTALGRIAALEAAMASKVELVVEQGGTYTVANPAAAQIFVGPDNPGSLGDESKDIYLGAV